MRPIHRVLLSLIFVAALADLLLGAPAVGFSDTLAARRGTLAPMSEGIERAINVRINAAREAHRLTPLRRGGTLTSTAQTFARFMASTEKYGHDADGRTPGARASERGYHYCLVAENLGRFFSNEALEADIIASRLVAAWLESPGHRANLLEPLATETGIAVAIAADGTFFAVQMFGRPSSALFSFKVANESGRSVAYGVSGKSFTLPANGTLTHERCEPAVLTVSESATSEIAVAGAGAFVVRRNGPGLVVTRSR